MVYSLDTNVIIHYLHDHQNVCKNIRNAIISGFEIVVPKMTDYEIRRGFYIKPNPRKELKYKAFLSDCNIVDIDTHIWDYAIPVYAQHFNNRHTVGEIDILISAFCVQNDYTLVTNNTKDYKNVDGLKLADWTQAL